ncbi:MULTISPECIES: class I SAM-dependent methyltransferase [Bacillaceae]|uniref:Class I SAM-dependent methyltransferase n=1 Tax=Evansella alkalicola TaxID=745819 RepID=A0ABS6JPB7_9BACI|nr:MULTISPECIES: class I SAM-dependent methyltransferase [Bacillaceae]MBU9720411.1 class I SAM-dependent methyltransferase [Bacillus alkalicola]
MRKIPSEEFDQRVDFFDQMAQSTWLSKLHNKLIDDTGSWSGCNVLDVGCGTGRFLYRGATPSTNIFGIDISKGMIERAKMLSHSYTFHHTPSFLVGDAEELPYDEHTFHFVFSTCVVFLLPDPSKALNEMHRTLKQGGRIGLLNPSEHLDEYVAKEKATQWGLNKPESDSLLQWGRISRRRHIREEDMKSLFTEAGFSAIRQYKCLDDIALISYAVK